MTEQAERTYALIRLSDPDGGEPAYHGEEDERGEAYLYAYSSAELAEIDLRLNAFDPAEARVVEWPESVLTRFMEESKSLGDFGYVKIDPPLSPAELLAEIEHAQRHARHNETRQDDAETAVAEILWAMAGAETPEDRREAILRLATPTMLAHLDRRASE